MQFQIVYFLLCIKNTISNFPLRAVLGMTNVCTALAITHIFQYILSTNKPINQSFSVTSILFLYIYTFILTDNFFKEKQRQLI